MTCSPSRNLASPASWPCATSSRCHCPSRSRNGAWAGLVQYSAYDLRGRFGFASRLVNGGRSLYEVQQILGHSTPHITMRYAHLSNKSLLEAANAGSVVMRRPNLAA